MKIDRWIKLITSPESSDRIEAADDVPEAESKDVVPFLLACLQDRVPLVRTCAIGSLRNFPSRKVATKLREHISVETDNLSRAYLFSSLGEVGNFNDIGLLVTALNNEENEQIRLNAFFGLIVLVSRTSLREISLQLENDDYHIREATVNLLSDLFEIRNSEKNQIIETVRNAVEKENDRGTIDVLENLLKQIT